MAPPEQTGAADAVFSTCSVCAALLAHLDTVKDVALAAQISKAMAAEARHSAWPRLRALFVPRTAASAGAPATATLRAYAVAARASRKPPPLKIKSLAQICDARGAPLYCAAFKPVVVPPAPRGRETLTLRAMKGSIASADSDAFNERCTLSLFVERNDGGQVQVACAVPPKTRPIAVCVRAQDDAPGLRLSTVRPWSVHMLRNACKGGGFLRSCSMEWAEDNSKCAYNEWLMTSLRDGMNRLGKPPAARLLAFASPGKCSEDLEEETLMHFLGRPGRHHYEELVSHAGWMSLVIRVPPPGATASEGKATAILRVSVANEVSQHDDDEERGIRTIEANKDTLISLVKDLQWRPV